MSKNWCFATFIHDLKEHGSQSALIAVRHGSTHSLSFAALEERIRTFTEYLLGYGLSNNLTVGLIGPNSFEWVIACFAVRAIGATVAFIDEPQGSSEWQAQLESAHIAHVICSHSTASRLKESGLNFNFINLDLDELSRLEPKRSLILEAQAPDQPAMIAFTSGTTGRAKAIVLSNRNIGVNVSALVQSHLVGSGDRVLLPLPMQHVYPFVVGLLTSLGSGAAVVFPEGNSGSQILEAIRLADVSAIVGVPRLYGAIVDGFFTRISQSGPIRRMVFEALVASCFWIRKKSLLNIGKLVFGSLRRRFGSHLHLFVSGGAHLENSILRPLIGLGYDVRTGYGLAETASMFTANLPGSERLGSDGKPLTGRVRIASADEHGQGEIELKGPQVFARYLGDPQTTNSAFAEDGWFRTGDLGYLDADGFLYVTGRKKNLLVLGGGKKIDPEVLEKIYGNSKYIREIAVLERAGKLCALIVPASGAVRDAGPIHVDKAIRMDIARIARTRASFEVITDVAITRTPLPRTRLGKLRRFLLSAQFDEAHQNRPVNEVPQLSNEDRKLISTSPAREIYEMLHQRCAGSPMNLDANPVLDLGMDSLEWISFGLELEDKFGLRLSDADIGRIATVRDLLQLAVAAVPVAEELVESKVDRKDWISPIGRVQIVLGAILHFADKIAMRALFGLKIIGAGNIPSDRNYVLVANHSSFLDAPILGAALSYDQFRKTYWASDKLLFTRWWQPTLMRAIRGYPIDERMPARALATSQSILERGGNIIWFPEGWRTPDGRLQSFLPGIGHLLLHKPTSVIPCYIEGAFEAWPSDKRWFHPRRIAVKFGRPIEPKDLVGLGSEHDAAHRIALRLHDAVELAAKIQDMG